MNTRYVAGLISVILLLSPALAFADFSDQAARAQAQAAALTSDQLNNIDSKAFRDAYLTAKIIGYDPAEIKQLKADVAQLKQENAQLRALVQAAPAQTAPVASAPVADMSLDSRVTKLEGQFDGLNNTLSLVVQMLTQILAKMR